MMRHRYSQSADPHACERLGRACLSAPQPREIVAQENALIDRALQSDPQTYQAWALPYFHLAKALSEFRQDNLDEATRLLMGDAGTALRPTQQFLLAMILERRGNHELAEKMFAEACQHEEMAAPAVTRERWIYHVLQRQTEAMLKPVVAR